MNKRIYFLLLMFFVVLHFKGYAQCDTIKLINDTTLCMGESIQLDAGPGFTSYFWNESTTEQFLTVTEPGTYYCDVEYLDSTNMVVNGDFSQGDVGFYTEYTWGVGGTWGILSEEGTYVIGENAALTHVNFSPCTDHTTGDGLYMIVNGDSVQQELVWCQSVDVQSNITYYFSGWFTSVHPSNPAILSYLINGVIVETVNLSSITCVWENFILEWQSENNSIAEICIINQNTELGGNDFGIDDIYLIKTCRSVDTVHIEYDPGPEINLGNDTTLCEGNELVLSPGYGFSSYLWNNGSEDSSLVITDQGVFWVEVTNEIGCSSIDTINVDFYSNPEVSLGNDTVICPNGEITLSVGEEFAGYIWQDESIAPIYVATEIGYYWVTVFDENGCSGSDTIYIGTTPLVNPDLGNDTTICPGDGYTLNPGSGFTQYMWQNGSTEPYLQIAEGGTYWVQVEDIYGCSGFDTILVNNSPSPTIDLGPDTTLCEGESLTLDVGSGYESYLWQDNSTSSAYYVYEAGYYTVTVTNSYNCEANDDIIVDIGSPEISLGQDTSLCYNDSIYLSPGENFAFYQWQDGSNQPSYHVTSSGTYSVFIEDEFGCSDEDEVDMVLVMAPTVDLGDDQEMCSGNSIILEAPVGPYTYYWNGVEGTATYVATKGGEYTIQLVNMCGDANDSTFIDEIENPVVNLGEDVLLNPGESIELDAGFGFDSYLWQDGSENQFFLVSPDNVNTQDPNYYVEVTNGLCVGSDTIEVFLFVVELPAVFTPNNDGKNDLFLPMEYSWNGITSHHISIFNRWGEQVWESENFEEGWDGKQNGKLVADGIYYWVLEVFYGPDNLKQNLKGNLSVLGGIK